MNQEMIANAEQLDLGPEAQQMVQQAIANQDGVLAQIRNQFQMGSGDSADSLIQNRVQEQQSRTTTDSATQSGAGLMGSAPSSGDCIPDCSGFEAPNGANFNTYGQKQSD